MIEQLATDYGTIRPAAIRTLIGAEHHENGAMFYRTLAVLPALVGAWRDRGGGLSRSVGSYHDALVDEAALTRPDLLAGRMPRHAQHEPARRGCSPTPTLDPPVAGDDRVEQQPARDRAQRRADPPGLARDDLFTVVHEQFLTDTARYADIVLPATTQLETTDVVPAWGHLWMGWNEAAIAPLGESCSNTELFRRLAGAMGFDEPALFDDDETLLAQALGQKVDLDELRARRLGARAVPATTAGRGARACSRRRRARSSWSARRSVRMGQPALPTFVAPREGPHGDAELHARYPLQLLTPKHHTRFLNSGYSHLPKHGPAEGAPFVELDAADAARPRPRRRRHGPGVERPGQRRAAGAGQRPAAARRRRHPVRLVDDAAPRRQGRPTRSPTTRSPSGAAASPTATRSSRSPRVRPAIDRSQRRKTARL